MKIKFTNATIVTMCDKQIIKDGCLCVEDDKIVFVGEENNLFNADKVIDCQGDIIMPGFVNSHAHNAMTLFRGIKDDVDLMEWLFETIFPLEKHLTGENVYVGTRLGVMENLASGITSCLDEYFYTPMIVRATQDVGMRLVVAVGIDNGQEVVSDKHFWEQFEKINKIKKDTTTICAYAHSIYTFNDAELEETARLARVNNCMSTIHCSETLTEVGTCAKENNDKSPVKYLEGLGFFDKPCVIAHGVHVDKDDIKILHDYDVSVASCPASNLKLGSGIAPICSLINGKVNVCLGTDGVSSNNAIDFFREMYLITNLQKGLMYEPQAVPAYEVLRMATVNGAKALQLHDVGQLKEGFKADIIRIDTHAINMQPLFDVFSNLVYSANKSNVLMTMVNGQIVYENGKWTNVPDIQGAISDVNNAIKDLQEKAKNEKAINQ